MYWKVKTIYQSVITWSVFAWSVVLAGGIALGATATLTPTTSTTVLPGTSVSFDVLVSAETMVSFDSADIAIGSNSASNVSFVYAPSWMAAFSNVTPVTADVGLYAQDVFVGGNNPSPVGSSLLLGTVSVSTDGMLEGTYDVRIDANIVTDVSSLVLDGTHEDIQGLASFTISCATSDPQCDLDVDLADYQLLLPCVSGPSQKPSISCQRFDTDGDGDVDFSDMRFFMTDFTGSF